MLALISCNTNDTVDSLIGAPANTIEVPLDLQITITSPASNGKNVGYLVHMSGGCTAPGAVVEFRGDATGFSACLANNTWEANVDVSGAAVGTITVRAYLINGGKESGAAIRIFNKENSDCDSAAARAAVNAGGDGSVGDPYRICTSSQLSNVRSNTAANYILKNDIDMKSVPFTPIPNTFDQTFDGNGFSILDLYINELSANDVGLFIGLRNGAVVKDLTIEGANVSGPGVVGIIVGRVSGTGATIQDVSVEGRVTASGNWAGGIAGHVAAGADFTVSNVNVDISSLTATSYGGLILGGTNATAGTILISNITASGSVTVSTNYAGGIVGILDTTTSTLTNLTVAGDIAINGGTFDNYVGGIVGRMDGGDIDTCNVSGTISATGSYVGGVVGSFAGTKIWNCATATTIQVDTTLRAAGYVGGIVGYASTSNTDLFSLDVDVDISVNGLFQSSYYGGIGGRVYGTSIDTCDAHGDAATGANGRLYVNTGDGVVIGVGATTGSNQVGGAFGRFDIPNGTSLTVNDCNASVDVTLIGANTNGYVGGFLGYSVPGDGATGSSITITNSLASGDVVANNRYVAGHSAYIYLPRAGSTGVFTSVRATGDVTVTSENGISLDYIGGLFGAMTSRDNGDAQNPAVGYQLSGLSATGIVDADSGANGGNYIGGLIGYLQTGRTNIGGSTTTLTNAYATGNVFARSTGATFNYVGGFAGRIHAGNTASVTVDNSGGPVYALGNVESYGDEVGGFLGRLTSGTNSTTLLQNVYSNGNVIGERYVGGLIGYASNGATAASMTIDNVKSHDSNIVTAPPTVLSNNQDAGGIIGYATSTGTAFLLSNCESISAVTSTGTNVGGLIGQDRDNVDISSCTATGNVSGQNGYVGGLTGGSNRTGRDYSDVHATGDVTVTVTGTPFDLVFAGGLAGYHRGSITGATAIGDVSVILTAGTTISNAYVGGLVGYANGSAISQTYAKGSISYDTLGAGNMNYTGGLIGLLNSTSSLDSSFALGDVIGGNRTGGLVGQADIGINNSMAAGNVSGTQYVGGLVGYHNAGVGSVTGVYALGAVSRNSGAVVVNFGELVGYCANDNRVVNGYYNASSSTVAAGLTPFANCNSASAARSLANGLMLSPGAGLVGFNFDCSGGALSTDWCYPTALTKKGSASVFQYPVLKWATP